MQVSKVVQLVSVNMYMYIKCFVIKYTNSSVVFMKIKVPLLADSDFDDTH